MLRLTAMIVGLIASAGFAVERIAVELRSADPAAKQLQAAFSDVLAESTGRVFDRHAEVPADRFDVRAGITLYADRAMLSVRLIDAERAAGERVMTRAGSIAEIDRLQRELADELAERLERRIRRTPADVPPAPADVRGAFERSLRTSLPAVESLPTWQARPARTTEAEQSRINRTFHQPMMDPYDVPYRFWWCW